MHTLVLLMDLVVSKIFLNCQISEGFNVKGVKILKLQAAQYQKFWNLKSHKPWSLASFKKKIKSTQLYTLCLVNNMAFNFSGEWDIMSANVRWISLCKCQFIIRMFQKHISLNNHCWSSHPMSTTQILHAS